MVGSRMKKDAYSALQRLMEEAGSDHVVLQDLLHSIDTNPTNKIARLLAGIPDYSDRDVAIVFGSILERALELAISTHFSIGTDEARHLFSYTNDGPLANFAAKIAMGYALGIYDKKMQSDLRWIARIRNAFAHARVDVSFGTDAIDGACDQLILPARTSGIARTPRQRFTACVGLMALYLRNDSPAARKFHDSKLYQTMYPASA
jgi:hypothetical protein